MSDFGMVKMKIRNCEPDAPQRLLDQLRAEGLDAKLAALGPTEIEVDFFSFSERIDVPPITDAASDPATP